jgi:hypothetical protein
MIDLILQGPVYPYTKDIIDYYLQSNLVSKVILSCWDTCKTDHIFNSKVVIIKNKDVAFCGCGNINRQILSSMSGLQASNNHYCAKMRTDQKVSHNSLDMMHRFYLKFKNSDLRCLDGSGPNSSIFVAGMYTRYAFHPRDHIFWGHKSDLIRLFNIPYSELPLEVSGEKYNNGEGYWRKTVRPESYLGTHYCSNFDERVLNFTKDFASYIVDSGSKHNEAMRVSAEIKDKVFKVFPRIELEWAKYNLKNYHYHIGQTFTEYWYDNEW